MEGTVCSLSSFNYFFDWVHWHETKRNERTKRNKNWKLLDVNPWPLESHDAHYTGLRVAFYTSSHFSLKLKRQSLFLIMNDWVLLQAALPEEKSYRKPVNRSFQKPSHRCIRGRTWASTWTWWTSWRPRFESRKAKPRETRTSSFFQKRKKSKNYFEKWQEVKIWFNQSCWVIFLSSRCRATLELSSAVTRGKLHR